MLQGDTVYDMIERQDVDMVRSNLDINNNSPSGNLTLTDRNIKLYAFAISVLNIMTEVNFMFLSWIQRGLFSTKGLN